MDRDLLRARFRFPAGRFPLATGVVSIELSELSDSSSDIKLGL